MKKVSILTPCYNSGQFIHRLLNSILEQTYPTVEMFVVNDGSTDDSEEIIQSYIPKFSEKGYSLQCVNQYNQGQGAAINNGLKLITGNYLIWPDSDDFFSTPDTIAKMVKAFNDNTNASIVRCFSSVLDEQSLEKVGEFGGKKFIENRKIDLFEDCLFVKNNFWFGAGNYMLKTEILDYYYPNRDIYPSNKYGGQNWQLLLPGLYKRECITIKEHLYNILAREKSHSRIILQNLNSSLLKHNEHEKILLETLDHIKDMSDTELFNYKEKIKMKYTFLRIKTLLKYNRIYDAKIEYKKTRNTMNLKDRLLILINFLPCFEKAKSLIKSI